MIFILPQWLFAVLGFIVAFPSAMYYRQKWVDSVYIIHYWEKDAVVALLLALLGVAIMAFGVFPYLPKVAIMISP